METISEKDGRDTTESVGPTNTHAYTHSEASHNVPEQLVGDIGEKSHQF